MASFKFISLLCLLQMLTKISIGQERKDYTFSYRATYEMSFRRDSLSDQKEKQVTYLSFNDSTSVFRTEEKRHQDSTRYQYLYGKVKPRGGHMYVIGQSREDNLIVKEGNIIYTFENLFVVSRNDVNYYFEEKKSDQGWKILDDTLQIGGFVCQKATLHYGNRYWTAWFTSEIPISDGPYRFSGLPGLIVKIEDRTKSWQFELLSLERIEHRVSINFDKSIHYKKTNKAEFYKQKKYLLDNIVDLRTSSNDATIDQIEQFRAKVANVRKADNNWIELYP